ncbi:MAG TPA: DUF3500 domain-containing protein [Tepidisphaeraceae bacterium]|nr:DUF3500 domain-containing protein [Tepidisphaeraceae bacterium]
MSHPNLPRAYQCGDCESPSISRRQFIHTTAGAVVAAGATGLGLTAVHAAAEAPAPGPFAASGIKPSSETLVAQLYKSLKDAQRQALCFPFDHELRLKVDNNWQITPKSIADVLDGDQRALVRDIFMGMHSDEYAKKVFDQVEHDGGGPGTFEKECAIALFGEPDPSGAGEKSKFEFVLTGRHCTRRCDGNSVSGAAFGGPIFYGHAAQGFNETATHPGNAYWYQALRANEVFKSLDGRQRKLALRTDARKEQGTSTVALTGKKQGLPGIPVSELSSDQKDLVRKVMSDLLAPFRKADADEAMKLVEAGGFDSLHLAYYRNMDIGNDGVWDVWQVEGPGMLWYFRGAPHVHTWVNIREPQGA